MVDLMSLGPRAQFDAKNLYKIAHFGYRRRRHTPDNPADCAACEPDGIS
jgi:hypothetical protein